MSISKVSFREYEDTLRQIDKMINEGIFKNRTEFFREATFNLLHPKSKIIFEDLRDIEYLARQKFGVLGPDKAFTHFIREIGEILTADHLVNFVEELLDIFAFGYAVAMSHGMTHSRFVSIVDKKIKSVKERMKHG